MNSHLTTGTTHYYRCSKCGMPCDVVEDSKDQEITRLRAALQNILKLGEIPISESWVSSSMFNIAREALTPSESPVADEQAEVKGDIPVQKEMSLQEAVKICKQAGVPSEAIPKEDDQESSDAFEHWLKSKDGPDPYEECSEWDCRAAWMAALEWNARNNHK